MAVQPDGPWLALRARLRTQLEPASKIEVRTTYLLMIAAVLAFYLALRGTTNEIKESRRQGILTTCREANVRHVEAIPQIVGLIKSSPQKDPAQRAAENEAILALTKGVEPKTAAGHIALVGTEGFIDIIAPAYNCRQRLKAFTLP